MIGSVVTNCSWHLNVRAIFLLHDKYRDMPSPLASARQFSCVETNAEPQVAAVCYRRKSGGIEFLLVNTSAGKWTFPKGGVGCGISQRKAALQEAWEEAGVSGTIDRFSFASYQHDRNDEPVSISAFLLNVQRTEDPIETFRNPQWFRAEKAKKRLSESRSLRYRREFSRVIDLALIRLGRRYHTRAWAIS